MWSKKKTEKELIEGIIRSDVSSYEEVYRHWFPLLRTFVFGMIKDSARAEDIAQNVLMKLWLKRDSLDSGLSLKNWLFVLARNEIFNVLKSKGQRMLSYTDELPESGASESVTEESIYLGEAQSRMSALLSSMPEKRREAFLLSRQGHLDTEEIARRMNISPRTVEKHLELALRDLRKRMN
ncbi:MAG: RNA polymerase sigma factor [Candidatus Cryptobacteroides sp.]